MKKFLLSITVFITSAVYVAYHYIGGNDAAANTQATAASTPPIAQQTEAPAATVSSPSPVPATEPTQPPQSATPAPATPAPAPAPTPAPVATPAPKPKGQYVDGTYTGSQADAYYGTVQVQATIQGGKLTDVTFLQYPNDRRTSQYINSQAIPQLRQEAIAAQSADVSGVSGASDTSAAFQESLASALSQAKS